VPYTHASTFEINSIENNGLVQWQLRALKNNLYVTAENGGGTICIANRTEASGWETFDVTFLPNDRVQLRSISGYWLGIDGSMSSSLIASATSLSTMETFVALNIPQQRSVNLGSWFIPEKWMFSSESALWANTTATDLFTLCTQLGPEEAGQRMNSHWRSWYTEDDFRIMADNGINHVRIPMGYWDIIETSPYVFGGAEFIDQAIKWANAYEMTVLIDLHGAPGSQNGQDHSGKAGEILWPEPENVAETVRVLGMISKRWASVSNVWGFEFLNEPHYSISHDLLTQFYRDAYEAIRESSNDTHVVINSLYGPHDWTAQVLPEPQYRNAVLDLHLYTVWSGFYTEQQYYDAAAGWGDDIRALTPYYPVIVGEMSLGTALNPYTDEQRQKFADGEMISFIENAFGYYFWSDKLEYSSEDWDFRGGFPYIKDYYVL
jgi:glucan 1,3-beta-glucosidase